MYAANNRHISLCLKKWYCLGFLLYGDCLLQLVDKEKQERLSQIKLYFSAIEKIISSAKIVEKAKQYYVIKGINLKTNIKGPNISGNLPNVELGLNKANINPLNVNLEGKMPEGNLNIPKKVINANIDIKDKDLNLKTPEVNLNLDINIPNQELNLNGKIDGVIDGKLPGLKSKIDLDRKDIELKGSKNFEVKGEIPSSEMMKQF